MAEGSNRASKRPNFLAVVKDGTKPPRDPMLGQTLPLGFANQLLIEETGIITSPDPVGSPVCDRGTLTMVTGAEAGSVFRLESTTVVGRSPDCQIQIDHAGISRRHAKVAREGDTDYVIYDLGSRNGTTVRGRSITRCRLVDGDRIGFGPIFFRFALTDEREEQALRQRYEFSVLDGLTGALNRKHFDDRLISELAFAKRHQTPVSLLILDVDHFKSINDRLGHQAGDAVLRQLATTVKTALRLEDVFARYGGEEFAVVARSIGRMEAMAFADRIRHLVANTQFVYEEEPIAITISVGVATLADCNEPSVDQLVRMADAGLYVAKASGRNCCKRA